MSHSSSRSRTRSNVRSRYEESDFPTKIDYGEGDEYQIPREVDLNEHKDKSSGWSNPLSWEDDGSDDDSILNLGYDASKLKDKEEKLTYGDNNLDQDIKDTLENEVLSAELVAKQRIKWREMEEEEAAIEEAKSEAKSKSKKKGGKKAAAEEDEDEENPKASVAGEKENNKKAPKNTAKKEKVEKEDKEEKEDKVEKTEKKEGKAGKKEEKEEDKAEEGEDAKKEEDADAKPAKDEKKKGKEEKKEEKAEEGGEDAKAEDKPKEGKKPKSPTPVKNESKA